MLLRLILILTLVVQQPALLAVVSSAAQAEECVETSCCRIVETKTCCGDVVREMRCSKTGGDCLCGVVPGDPEPTPEAPRPTDRTEIAPIFVALLSIVIDLPTPARVQAPPALPAIVRSHNETHALLCIWRT